MGISERSWQTAEIHTPPPSRQTMRPPPPSRLLFPGNRAQHAPRRITTETDAQRNSAAGQLNHDTANNTHIITAAFALKLMTIKVNPSHR